MGICHDFFYFILSPLHRRLRVVIHHVHTDLFMQTVCSALIVAFLLLGVLPYAYRLLRLRPKECAILNDRLLIVCFISRLVGFICLLF